MHPQYDLNGEVSRDIDVICPGCHQDGSRDGLMLHGLTAFCLKMHTHVMVDDSLEIAVD